MTRALLKRTVETLRDHQANWSEATRQLVLSINAELAKPERKPMTEDQINAMWPSPEGTNSIHALVRAVEAFHNIEGSHHDNAATV